MGVEMFNILTFLDALVTDAAFTCLSSHPPDLLTVAVRLSALRDVFHVDHLVFLVFVLWLFLQQEACLKVPAQELRVETCVRSRLT